MQLLEKTCRKREQRNLYTMKMGNANKADA